MSSKNAEKIIAKLNRSFNKDHLKQTFSQVICKQMSERTLSSIDFKELQEFILILYEFFIIKHHSNSQIFLGEPALNSATLTNKVILKMCHEDASHLFITVEEVLRKYKLRTTRRIHPIIGVERDESGKIINILPPKKSKERRSLVFIAFESVPNDDILNTIKADLKFHMQAVQYAQKDSEKIHLKLTDIERRLTNSKTPYDIDWLDLIRWINDYNFSFFGFHLITHEKKSISISNHLGICKSNLNIQGLISPIEHTIEHANNEDFIVDRTTIMSPIQRFEPLMKVSFKFKNEQYIFYGILKRSSMYAKNIETPLIQKKMEYIFKERNFLPGSYDFNEVVRIFNDIPKFELFRTTKERLLEMVDSIMSITNTNHIQCFKRFHPKTNYLTLYFVIPYYFFNIKTVEIITEYISSQLDFSFHEVLSINAPEKCRIHCHYRLNSPEKLPSEEVIERTLIQLVQPWEEQCYAHIMKLMPDVLCDYPNIIEKIPSHYKARTAPASSVRDLKNLFQLSTANPILFDFFLFNYPLTSDLAGKVSSLLVYHSKKLDLTNILPIFHNLGIHVIDQITSRFGDTESTIGYIHTFRILNHNKQKINEELLRDRLIDALKSIFNGPLPNDPINSLILKTELNADDIMLLQGIRNYGYQLFQSQFSLFKINETITFHGTFFEELIDLFRFKFSPKSKKITQGILDRTNHLTKYIKSVQSIIDDQILRRFLSIVSACVRTNTYIKNEDDPISFKFRCNDILGVTSPVPFMESFVFDQHLEGVHIRFGKVSRGGLRWSSRHDDYRTEVLDLVKTQQTKNAVIIPAGSKGGFIIKETTITQEVGIEQYKRFINGLLQLCDNVVNQKRSTHSDLITYDEFDPYFVVAADKGTATFSDYANRVSLDKGFWLGDGFASGGEHGYDHKKVGITAKGAWECCKLHFHSMDINPEKDSIKVIGVGDMSGDVFGNGMLLSSSIQLVAAFNHQHIFIDPDPDPKKSYKERLRLFKKDRSTWSDYTSFSKGGGVFDRESKVIHLSKEIKTLFNISQTSLSGEALIKIILCSHVDLIWFGGIGTYIKSSTETDLDVGDPSNNSVRVNANEVNAKVISEGANLGLTQLARIEYEKNSGRINTDAIDNSAGVNMSDYEVNIKILLSSLTEQGKIKTIAKRNSLLDQATDEVTELVLQNNIIQHQLISMDQYRSKTIPLFIEDTLTQLEREQRLPVKDEKIPTAKERLTYYTNKRSLPRCVIAKCQAYTKMKIKESLSFCELFDNHYYDMVFFQYFPKTIQKIMSFKKLPNHRLKKEIITTELTNHIVGIYGLSTYEKITFRNTVDAAKSCNYIIMLESIFDFPKLRMRLDSSSKTKLKDLIELNDLLIQATHICHILDININPSNLKKYIEIISKIKFKPKNIPSLCLLLSNDHSKGDPESRLAQLNTSFLLLSNIQALACIEVSNKMEYQEQQSILTDLIYSLSDLMKLTDKRLKTILKNNQSEINSIKSKFTFDQLSHFVIYSFRVRQFIKQTL